MILKVGGIIVVFAACVAAGLMKTASLAKRVRELQTFLNALSMISDEIRFFATPTNEIISKLDNAEGYKQLRIFAFCRENLKHTRDFSKAWGDALASAKPFLSLDDGDIEALSWFGSVFGTTDAQGQTANCERYYNLLQQRLECARDDKEKRGKMFTSLGVLAGAFFAVMFL